MQITEMRLKEGDRTTRRVVLELDGDEPAATRQEIVDLLARAATDPTATQLILLTRTQLGQGGIRLALDGGRKVSGHKLEAAPETLTLEAEPFDDARSALLAFTRGQTVRFSDGDDHLLLRWNPIMPEAFATGHDTA